MKVLAIHNKTVSIFSSLDNPEAEMANVTYQESFVIGYVCWLACEELDRMYKETETNEAARQHFTPQPTIIIFTQRNITICGHILLNTGYP